MNSVIGECCDIEKLEKNMYNNVLKHVEKKMIDVYRPKIIDRIKALTYDILPQISACNVESTSSHEISIKDSAKVADMRYGKSIFCDTTNKITYELNGKYCYFTSYVSVCDIEVEFLSENVKGVNLKLPHPVGKVMFSVFVDDALVYFSSVMNSHSLPEYIHVDVRGKEKLELVVENIDDGNEVDTVWLEPTLYKEELKTQPCEIEYKRNKGTFLYCNNPESIKWEDTLDNGKILYTAREVCGDVCFFAEQNNSTGDDMYYAVLVENIGNDKASIEVINKGMSKNWWTGIKADENAWKNFTDSSKYQLEVLPNKSAWLLDPTNVACYNQYTGEGVVNLAIHFKTDIPVVVSVVAFTKNYKIESPDNIKGTYEGYVIRRENYWGEARNYKGMCNNYPKQECVIKWEIDDNTKVGYLPVRYNNLDRAGWITHITNNKHTSAMGSDMYTFVDPNGLCFGHNSCDYSSMISNLGNWGIVYKEVIEVKNNSCTSKNIDIILKNAFINNGVIVITPSGELIKSAANCDNIKNVATLEVNANDTKQYVMEYMLPACSVGGLAHYVRVY